MGDKVTTVHRFYRSTGDETLCGRCGKPKDNPLHDYVGSLQKINQELRLENKELNRIFELQQQRLQEADKLWRTATGRKNVIPDLGALLTWLMDERKRLLEENKEMKKRLT